MTIYQCILKHATVYIADMKGGLEFLRYFSEKCTIVADKQQFLNLLNDILSLIEDRRNILKEAHARDIAEYNKKCSPSSMLNRIVVFCDELADALDKTGLNKDEKEQVNKIESGLSFISRQGRAFGVHLILATQRPDADIVKGQIKANIGYKCCGRADKILSQIILDDNSAAEKISPDSQGLFCTNMGTLFKAFYLDDSQLE